MLEFSGAELVKEAYPKFSQFKKNVLDNSIADINRLKQLGQIDVCISYEPIYNGKRKVGNPAFIEFTIYDTIEQMQQAILRGQREQQPSLFADDDVKTGEKEWQQLLRMIDKDLAADLRKAQFLSYKGTYILLGIPNKTLYTMIEEHFNDIAVKNHIEQCLVKVFGKIIAMKYKIIKQ